jgi:ParB family chromosome partitioning protein
MEKILVPYKSIIADEEFNARKLYEGIEDLAAQIKSDGLLNPIIVREAPGSGENGRARYSIVVGFRRHRAIGHLAKMDGESKDIQELLEAVPVQVYEGPDKEAYFVNLAENEARASLKPWELAERCKFLKDKFGMSGTEIGNRLGKTKGYVNNLIYIVERLHPEIYEVFKTGHVGVIPCERIASIEDKDEQMEMYMREYAKIPRDGDEGGEKRMPGEPQPQAKRRGRGPRRPGEKRLLEALEAARRAKYKRAAGENSWRGGMILALRFARGETKEMAGVFPTPTKAAESKGAKKSAAKKPRTARGKRSK